MGMVKRMQLEEMDDVETMNITRKKEEKHMNNEAKGMLRTKIAEVAGVDVKSLLRKMGALKEDEPVAPKDIEWGNYAEIMRIWEKAQKGEIPQVWKGLKTAELNDKLQRLVKAIRNPNRRRHP